MTEISLIVTLNNQFNSTQVKYTKHIIITLRKGRLVTIKLCSGNPEMTNLRTDEIVFFHNLTKIGTGENKAIYSNGLR